MLSVNKPMMKQKFSSMLMDNTGLFYKAAYNAQYELLKNEYDDLSSEFKKNKAMRKLTTNLSASMDKSAKGIIGKAKSVKVDASAKVEPITIDNLDSKMKEKSKIFAKAFVKALRDGGLDDILADEIDKHVKAMELIITMQPQGLATIVSPTGPCTGSMIISKATATTQIL